MSTGRGIFHAEEIARQVAARLVGSGFAAQVARVAFAGDDDDEDASYSVSTDAPDAVFELLIDEFDGWYDVAEPLVVPSRAAKMPVDLPAAPRRRTKR